MSIEHIQAHFAPTCASLSRQIAELERVPSTLADHQDQVRELESALTQQEVRIQTLETRRDSGGRGVRELESSVSTGFLTKVSKDTLRLDLLAKRQEYVAPFASSFFSF